MLNLANSRIVLKDGAASLMSRQLLNASPGSISVPTYRIKSADYPPRHLRKSLALISLNVKQELFSGWYPRGDARLYFLGYQTLNLLLRHNSSR